MRPKLLIRLIISSKSLFFHEEISLSNMVFETIEKHQGKTAEDGN